MRLAADEALSRLAAHDHGVLGTLHPDRGADTVPCVYAVVGDLVGVPVDLVKPKASTRLQRHRNLEHDPRATLLVEHWDRSDWSALWWVRASLRWEPDPGREQVEALSTVLAQAFPQYRDRPFADVICLRVTDVAGWSAS